MVWEKLERKQKKGARLGTGGIGEYTSPVLRLFYYMSGERVFNFGPH